MTTRSVRSLLLLLLAAFPSLVPAGVATVRIPFELDGLPADTEGMVINCYVMDSTRQYGTGAGGGSAHVVFPDRAFAGMVRVALRRDTTERLERPSTRLLCRVSLIGGERRGESWAVEGATSDCPGKFCGSINRAAAPRSPVGLRPADGTSGFIGIDRSLPASIAAALERPGMGSCPCGCGMTDTSNSASCRGGGAGGAAPIPRLAKPAAPPPSRLPRSDGQPPLAASAGVPPKVLPGGTVVPSVTDRVRSQALPGAAVDPPATVETEQDKTGFPPPYLDLAPIRFRGGGALVDRR